MQQMIGIAEAARMTGLSIQTLRQYERKGLLPGGRTPGGRRLFRPKDLEKLLSPRRRQTKGEEKE